MAYPSRRSVEKQRWLSQARPNCPSGEDHLLFPRFLKIRRDYRQRE